MTWHNEPIRDLRASILTPATLKIKVVISVVKVVKPITVIGNRVLGNAFDTMIRLKCTFAQKL